MLSLHPDYSVNNYFWKTFPILQVLFNQSGQNTTYIYSRHKQFKKKLLSFQHILIFLTGTPASYANSCILAYIYNI